MTDVEDRILRNQIEIMWTLHYLLKCAKPDLTGKGGELDRTLDDLRCASKDTATMANARFNQQQKKGG